MNGWEDSKEGRHVLMMMMIFLGGRRLYHMLSKRGRSISVFETTEDSAVMRQDLK